MWLKDEHVRSEPLRIEEPNLKRDSRGDFQMAKKSRGGRMTAAKKRAAKSAGGRGSVRKRRAGRNIMRT
jgi:hypothetical protein